MILVSTYTGSSAEYETLLKKAVELIGQDGPHVGKNPLGTQNALDLAEQHFAHNMPAELHFLDSLLEYCGNRQVRLHPPVDYALVRARCERIIFALWAGYPEDRIQGYLRLASLCALRPVVATEKIAEIYEQADKIAVSQAPERCKDVLEQYEAFLLSRRVTVTSEHKKRLVALTEVGGTIDFPRRTELCWRYLDEKNYAEALTWITPRLASLASGERGLPRPGHTIRKVGLIYLGLEKYDLAKAWLEHAKRIGVKDVEEALASAYFGLGEYEAAALAYRAALAEAKQQLEDAAGDY